MMRIPTVSRPAARVPDTSTAGRRVLGLALLAAGVGVVVATGALERAVRLARRAAAVVADRVEDVTDALDDAAEALEERLQDVPVAGAVADVLEDVTDALDDAAEAVEDRLPRD